MNIKNMMTIKSAVYVKSAPTLHFCTDTLLPEYAFIGRSNVGKSSLINYITGIKGLAKTSNTPGKTQCLNFFIINNSWHLVDLPGLGYAKISRSKREKWETLIAEYLQKRKQLLCTFFLIDVRHSPQKIDLEFMEWMAEKALPFVIVFTKIDKLSKTALDKNITQYRNELFKSWQELPEIFLTSSEGNIGKEELLSFITETNKILL